MRSWSFIGIEIVIIATVMVIILSVSLFCSHTKTAAAIGTENHSSEYVFKIMVQCFMTGVDKLLSVTDVSGNVVTSTDNSAGWNTLLYRGYIYDRETGLYYLNSRYYDPETGRFISADAYISTGNGLLGYNMYTYCLNNPMNYKDSEGNDPIPVWADNIINGTATVNEYLLALSVNPEAWRGSARYRVDQAIDRAKIFYVMEYSEHHSNTNPANRNKHEAGQKRKQLDQDGEKKNKHPGWKPNPNKRHDPTLGKRKFSKIELDEQIFGGVVIFGATLGISFLIVNDITGVGVIDDAAIMPLATVIFDRIARLAG